MTKLRNIKIVLVEPAGALNVGSVARAIKNMGLEQLVLVNPHCDPHGEEARRMAVHGVDVLEKAQQVNSLPCALVGCGRAIATTARSRSIPTQLESPRVALPWLLAENMTSALIFGPEDRGLSNVELNYAQRFVSIPANPDYPSLNLAAAVTVCAYELYLASRGISNMANSDRPILPPEDCATLQETQEKTEPILSPSPVAPAALDSLERYYQHLETLLLKIGYLYPHTAAARMEKFRRLFNRANLRSDEVAMLRGILSQMDWAMGKTMNDE